MVKGLDRFSGSSFYNPFIYLQGTGDSLKLAFDEDIAGSKVLLRLEIPSPGLRFPMCRIKAGDFQKLSGKDYEVLEVIEKEDMVRIVIEDKRVEIIINASTKVRPERMEIPDLSAEGICKLNKVSLTEATAMLKLSSSLATSTTQLSTKARDSDYVFHLGKKSGLTFYGKSPDNGYNLIWNVPATSWITDVRTAYFRPAVLHTLTGIADLMGELEIQDRFLVFRRDDETAKATVIIPISSVDKPPRFVDLIEKELSKGRTEQKVVIPRGKDLVEAIRTCSSFSNLDTNTSVTVLINGDSMTVFIPGSTGRNIKVKSQFTIQGSLGNISEFQISTSLRNVLAPTLAKTPITMRLFRKTIQDVEVYAISITPENTRYSIIVPIAVEQ